MVPLSIQPIVDLSSKFEKCKKNDFLDFEENPWGDHADQNPIFFFLKFFYAEKNVADNSGMPLSANLWG